MLCATRRLDLLLDVNVLVALIDPAHVAHDTGHVCFEETGKIEWPTCPLTENGVIRIGGHPRYPNRPGTPADVADVMRGLCRLPGHRFWPDDLSLLDANGVDLARVLTSAQVTDTYLLALAVAHGGRLATFDRRLSAAAVDRGPAAIHQVGS